MTNTYKNQHGDRLTFLFPEALEVNRFELVERHADRVHVFTFTLLDEQPNSELNQALCKAISSKAHVLITVARNGGVTRSENVVVNQPESPNVYRLSVIGSINKSVVQGVPQR